MIYLNSFTFAEEYEDVNFLWNEKACYNQFYPFKVLSSRGFRKIDFEPITIIYGGNGTGKSTVLNVIAEKLRIKRDSIFNKTASYPDYVNQCQIDIRSKIPKASRVITSDDVFDYMLNIRNLNEGIDQKRDEVFEEYLDAKYSQFKVHSIEDYEQLKKVNKARSKTQTQFVKSEVMDNIREYSNGESAFRYFIEKIGENGFFILDEPENSLSPKRQMELADFITDSVRFYECQVIISTHSPFLLALRGAKIYDLDENPVTIKHWTELENIRLYHEFFKTHINEF